MDPQAAMKATLAAAKVEAQKIATQSATKAEISLSHHNKKAFLERDDDDFRDDQSQVFPHHVDKAEPTHEHQIFTHRVFKPEDFN